MTEKIKEIHELTCKKCGKVVKSLNENQANYNMKAHELTHEIEEERLKEHDN